ncbi:MAG: hypothetical protein RSD12_09270, partial [Akkermansia sp.]
FQDFFLGQVWAVTFLPTKITLMVSQVYRSLFKSVKQLLHIKSFVRTSSNAILTQIWTAMIEGC